MIRQNTDYSSSISTNIDLISDEVKKTNIQVEKGNQSTEYEPFYITNSTKITQNKNHTLTAMWDASRIVHKFYSKTIDKFHKIIDN